MLKINDLKDKTPEQLQVIKQFAAKPLGFLLLSGKNGTGKSFIAEAIYELNTPYKLPYYDSDVAIFVNQADLNEKWLDEKAEGSTKELMQRHKNVKLLVLDDLGTKTPSDAFGDFIYAIIDHRWRERDKLGTIITTNLNSDDMAIKFSQAILSRVGSGLILRFDGLDRRIIKF